MQQAEWYYFIDNRREGPVEDNEIFRLISEKTIDSDTLVWKRGMIDWQSAAKLFPVKEILRKSQIPHKSNLQKEATVDPFRVSPLAAAIDSDADDIIERPPAESEGTVSPGNVSHEVIEEQWYSQSLAEFDNCREHALWIKCLALNNGDEENSKWAYVRERAAQFASHNRRTSSPYMRTENTHDAEEKTVKSMENFLTVSREYDRRKYFFHNILFLLSLLIISLLGGLIEFLMSPSNWRMSIVGTTNILIVSFGMGIVSFLFPAALFLIWRLLNRESFAAFYVSGLIFCFLLLLGILGSASR